MTSSASFASNFSGSFRLAWILVISMLLHVIVLSQVNWNRAHTPSSPYRFTVNLVSSSTSHLKKIIQDKVRPKESAVKPKLTKPVVESAATPTPQTIAPTHTGDTSRNDIQLDMNQLFNQAREYASTELPSTPAAFRAQGVYYGNYTGVDNGTFYVYLDNAGHATGSGESSTFGVNFMISGTASKEGLIQMSGGGIAGGARFEGKLNKETGEISGTWNAGSLGSGFFSGKHE